MGGVTSVVFPSELVLKFANKPKHLGQAFNQGQEQWDKTYAPIYDIWTFVTNAIVKRVLVSGVVH
jgi:hypothetical protein